MRSHIRKPVFAKAVAFFLSCCGLMCSAHQNVPTAPPSVPVSPIILFPAYAFSRLQVKVRGQSFEPSCPVNGTFEVLFNFKEGLPAAWTEECAHKMLKLVNKFDKGKGKPISVSSPRGVTTKLLEFGSPSCAPYYKPLYDFLATKGYVAGKSLRAACYDFRLTPRLRLHPFTPRHIKATRRLVVKTYRANGRTPVFLIGHSNGPLYAKAFLDAMTPKFKARYIAGFIPFAGNWPGQGSLASFVFSGVTVNSFAYFPSLARVFETFPSTYMSSARPEVFGSRINIIRDTTPGGKTYTPLDYGQLYNDANLPLARKLHKAYVNSVSVAPPKVDVFSIYGGGLDTIVGAVYNVTISAAQGTMPAELAIRDGDGNQEDITNESNLVWATQDCHRFATKKVVGDHVAYPDPTTDPAFHFNLPFAVNDELYAVLSAGKLPPLC